MRLAAKIFLAYSLVILVLAGIAVWSLIEVSNLSISDRSVTVKAAEALRASVALRETITSARRIDQRSVVFDDSEYAAASAAGAARISQEFDRLADLITTSDEKVLLKKAASGFAQYRSLIAETRDLRKRGNAKQAENLVQEQGQRVVDEVIQDLDRLALVTNDALDRTLAEANEALGQAQFKIEALHNRAWKAVSTAMIAGVLAALAGTAVIAFRMTRSLRRLSEATKAVAEGAFHEPLRVDSKDEIGELAKSFNLMAAQLREMDETKEKFYATVSHELRSPLTAMQEALRLIGASNAGPLSDRQARLVAILQKGTERLLKLVNEVLDLSRMSAGMLPVERHWFDVATGVRTALDELRSQAEQRGIALELEIAADTERMFGDQDRIAQVIVNLVGNALRFTPPGGRVTVKLEHVENGIQIQVEDTGIGIPAAQLPIIFDRFRQAHSGKGGTGLGLAIVKSLVEAHDGHVSVSSHEGKGTQFTVSLPQPPVEVAANLEIEQV